MELTTHTRQWDQAEGLRRLMATRFIRTIAIAGDSSRIPEIATRLAYALAGSGKQVLVIREEKTNRQLPGDVCFRLERNCQPPISADRPTALPVDAAVHQLQLTGPVLEPLAQLQQPDALADLMLQVQGVNVAVVSVDRQHIEEIVRVGALIQNIIIVMQPTAEGIQEAYRRIKILSMFKAKQHFRVLVNEVENEWEAQAQFKHFAWVASRYLHVTLEFLGWLPPHHVSMSRPGVIYERLVEHVDAWGYPSKEAMQLEAFLYALFGNEQNNGDRMEA